MTEYYCFSKTGYLKFIQLSDTIVRYYRYFENELYFSHHQIKPNWVCIIFQASCGIITTTSERGERSILSMIRERRFDEYKGLNTVITYASYTTILPPFFWVDKPKWGPEI